MLVIGIIIYIWICNPGNFYFLGEVGVGVRDCEVLIIFDGSGGIEQLEFHLFIGKLRQGRSLCKSVLIRGQRIEV